MDSDHRSRNISKDNCLASSVLFLLAAGLVTAGMVSIQANAQSDLFKLVTLKPAYDDPFKNDIEHILNSYHWPHPYVTGNFSCTDTSIYIMLLLERYGYTAACVTDWGPDNRSLNGDPVGHMWVAVNNPKFKDAWIFIDGDGGFYPNKRPLPDSIGLIEYGDTYQTGYITTDPLDYLAKYDSRSRQPWRQHYSLNDSNAPKPNALDSLD
ncbi:MAG: hypothetical protein ACE14P_00110 [Methanotrichaceae archaeon]